MKRVMQDAARVAGALGEPSRLALLSALLEREATVSDLASRLGLAQPRVSTHLARLRTAGLVTRGSIGRHPAYRVDAARASRRRFAAPCLDWTERQPHLGGALGAGILDALFAEGYVRRRPKGRDVRIVRPLAGWLAYR